MIRLIAISLIFLSSYQVSNVRAELNDSIDFKHDDRILEETAYKELNVERVIDGDTFIAEGLRIRLWGIDAPEKKEGFYEISGEALKYFLGTSVKCKLIDYDRYQRSVMHCLTKNNADIGAVMVKTGFAKDYKKYSGGFYQREQKFARDAGLGVWGDE